MIPFVKEETICAIFPTIIETYTREGVHSRYLPPFFPSIGSRWAMLILYLFLSTTRLSSIHFSRKINIFSIVFFSPLLRKVMP